MFDHGFDYPPSYQRFRDEIDRLAELLEKAEARIVALEEKQPKPNSQNHVFAPGEPRSYASAIKAFWEKKNV